MSDAVRSRNNGCDDFIAASVAYAAVFILLALFISLPKIAFAEANPEAGTFSIVVENDIFNSDSYYTNGIRASWLSTPGIKPDWALRAAHTFPYFPKEAEVRANYAVGQNMYTPRDIKLENPPNDDRPYAGWVYASVGLIAETGQWLDQLELTVGMVGPASLAEETQTKFHQLIGSPEPQGWDNQLKNEPGIILTYQHSWRSFVSSSLVKIPFDVTPHVGGAVGNVFTYANTGLTMRVGWNLPNDYGPPRIAPSMPGSGYFIPQKKFTWYLFSGIEGRAVARNIFLDGNTFSDSDNVDKERFVGDLQYGLVAALNNMRLSFTQIIRTKEFKTQDNRGQIFGAMSLSTQF